ncbi:monovalent cation/H(+) antiporter subunit G [Deltaproteobacteria bacterium PRO3]|nr:monovalent cation/H(+) antiporter subunit G [Deltaproteobacteria bacterium PRO3]
MNEWFAMGAMVLGTLLMGIAALGIFRLPDLFMRMHASSKAGALGVALQLLAVALYFDDLTVTVKAVVGILFFLLTAPVAAHMIGRAAYWVGVPLWEKSVLDELRGRYERGSQTLKCAKELEPKA